MPTVLMTMLVFVANVGNLLRIWTEMGELVLILMSVQIGVRTKKSWKLWYRCSTSVVANNPLFDGNHICASARSDVVTVCTNLVPTSDNYCETIDTTGKTAEEIKWLNAQSALTGACPGYSCECDTGELSTTRFRRTNQTFRPVWTKYRNDFMFSESYIHWSRWVWNWCHW